MALDMLGHQPSFEVQEDYFLPGFDSSLDDRGVDPWCPPESPFEVAGSQPTRHDLPFDVPVPAVYGMLGGSGSSSTSTAPIALQPQHLPPTGSQPPAVQPLHTMVRLQPAQQGAAITVSGFAKRNGPPLTQQQPWQQALLLKAPPAAFAEEDVLQFCSRFQRRPQRAAAPALPFLTAHQPIACQAPNGASTVAMPVEQNHKVETHSMGGDGDAVSPAGFLSRLDSSGSGGYSNEGILPEASSGGSPGPVERPAQRTDRLNGAAAKKSMTSLVEDIGKGTTARERNRIAQRRYRDRQKSKLQESEDKVAELTERLNRLATEKDSLAAHNEMLEKFLAAQQVPQPAPQPDQELQTVSSAGSNAVADLDVWTIDRGTQRLIDHALRLGPVCTFTVRPGETIRLSRKEVEDQDAKSYRPLWRDYIKAFKQLLQEADDDPQAPAATRLAQLVHEAQQLVGCVQMVVLDTKRIADSAHWEGVFCHEPGGSPMRVPNWGLTSMPATNAASRELRRQLSLSLEQDQALLRLRSAYLRNLGILLRRRQELAAAMQATLDELPAEKQRQLTQSHRRTTATMAAMRQTLHDEHSCLVQLKLGLLRELDQFQLARLYLCSYPACPDVVALVNCIAEDLDEPPAVELMRNNANSGADELEPIYQVDTNMRIQDAVNGHSTDNILTETTAPMAVPVSQPHR